MTHAKERRSQGDQRSEAISLTLETLSTAASNSLSSNSSSKSPPPRTVWRHRDRQNELFDCRLISDEFDCRAFAPQFTNDFEAVFFRHQNISHNQVGRLLLARAAWPLRRSQLRRPYALRLPEPADMFRTI